MYRVIMILEVQHEILFIQVFVLDKALLVNSELTQVAAVDIVNILKLLTKVKVGNNNMPQIIYLVVTGLRACCSTMSGDKSPLRQRLGWYPANIKMSDAGPTSSPQ